MDNTILTGACHCGRVQLHVPSSSVGVVACHCDDCQKLHGNFFAMLAVERAHVQIEGSEHIASYASSAGVQRSFCRHCGSRIAKDSAGSPRLLLAIGLFGRDTGKRIRRNVWTEHPPDWYTVPPAEAD